MQPKYDFNTGKLLEAGQQQAQFNTQTGQLIGSGDGYSARQPAVPKAPVMSPESLKPAAQYDVSIPSPYTGAAGIIGAASSRATLDQQAAQSVASLQATMGDSAAAKEQSSILAEIRRTIGDQSSLESSQAAKEAAAIEPERKALGEINSRIAEETVAYRAEEKRIRSLPSSEAQKAVELGNLEDQAGRRLADLAIRQSAAQGNIAGIRSDFERQTKLLTAPLERELRFQSEYRQKYADTLTAKEEQTMARVMQEKQRLIKETQDLQNAKAQMIAEISKNGGGADQATIQAVQAAGDITQIAEAGSRYVGKMDFLQAQANIEQSRAAAAASYANAKKIKEETKALSLPDVNDSQAGKYSGALGVILGSGKFTKDQKAGVINAVNNGEDPLVVIKNQAKGIMGQTLATDLDKAETAKAQLISLQGSLKDYYANGGDTSIFKGNYEKTLNKLGKTTDPKLAGIATEIALAMQSYRLAVTGTAASVQEDARIDNVFPGITTGQVLNNARTKANLKSFEDKIDSSYRNTLGSTYDTLINSAKADAVRQQVQPGEILIIRNGQIGAIPESEFNPKTDKKI